MIFITYLIGISLFVGLFLFGVVSPVFVSIVILIMLIFLINSEKFYFFLFAFLVAIKPITVDLFLWHNYLLSLKITYIYSALLILFSIIIILRLRIDITRFELWILPVLAFIYNFFTTFSSIQSGNILASLNYFLRSSAGIPFFFLFGYLLKDDEDLEKLLKIILIPLLIISFFSILFSLYKVDSFYMITGNQKQFWRLKLIYHDSTQLAWNLDMAIYLLSYFFIKYRKNYYLIMAYFILIPIYTTQTRSSWVSTALLLLVVFILVGKPQHILPLLIFGILNFENIMKRWAYAGIEFDEEGFSGRMGIWKDLIYDYANSDLYEKFFGKVIYTIAGSWSHNQYLFWLVNNGIFGLVFNLIIFGLLFYKAVLIKRNFLVLLGYIWVFVSGFLGNILFTPNVSIMLWLSLGYALRKLDVKEFVLERK